MSDNKEKKSRPEEEEMNSNDGDEKIEEEGEEMEEEEEESEEEEYDSEEARSQFYDYLSEYLSNFVHAIKVCTKETDVTSLDLEHMSFAISQLRPFFKLLPNSKITEFSVAGNDLRWGMPELIDALTKSNIQKLNLDGCDIQPQELFELAKNLKKTKITDLNLNSLSDVQLSSKHAGAFVDHLSKSHVTHLKLDACDLVTEPLGKHLALNLPLTSITSLHLQSSLRHQKEAIKILFTSIAITAVTELLVGGNEITDSDLKPLHENLRKSKLEKLGLHFNKITDEGVDILSEAAVGSELRELIVAINKISGTNNLSKHLKKTKINKLCFSMNDIKSSSMFSFPDFLKGTSVTEVLFGTCRMDDAVCQDLVKCLEHSEVQVLDLSRNNLGLLTISELAKVLKKTKMTEIDVSECKLTADALKILADGVKGSKLRNLTLRGITFDHQDSAPPLAFIESTKDIAFESFDMSCTNFKNESAKLLANSLKNTMITKLDISSCGVGAGVADLAPMLKHTAITCLDLKSNKITDSGAEKLAEHLSETNIFDLNLEDNAITDKGAKALVMCLKSGPLYRLNLHRNKNTEGGLDELAAILEGTFVTNLKIVDDSGQSMSVQIVLWRNKLLIHRLATFFKTIVPTEGDTFRFEPEGNDLIVFVEKCLLFYKAAVDEPSAIIALAHCEDIQLTRDKVAKLVLEKFPSQLALFVGSKVDLEVAQHVKFLERAEELGLSKIVELFLANLAVLVLDKSEGILHPSAYKLLSKYKMPICNLDMEPETKKKVIQYFTERSEIDGASDIVKLLQD